MDNTKTLSPEVENMPLLIEYANPEDAEAVMRLKRVAQIEGYASEQHGVSAEDMEKKFTEEDVIQGAKNWQVGISGEPHGGKRQTFVARISDRVVGFTSPCFEEEQWRVGQLYVDPQLQSQGIGSQLLKSALGWLGADKDVYLHVLRWNENAINLYERFGFVETGKEFPAEVDKEGRKLLPEIEMVRKAVH